MEDVEIWARLVNMPPECFGYGIPYGVAIKMGTCIMIELPAQSKITLTCPRALMKVNINERLGENIPMDVRNREIINIKPYWERLVNGFCKTCRVMNHPKQMCKASEMVEGETNDTIKDNEMELSLQNDLFAEEQLLHLTERVATHQIEGNMGNFRARGETSQANEIGQNGGYLQIVPNLKACVVPPGFQLMVTESPFIG